MSTEVSTLPIDSTISGLELMAAKDTDGSAKQNTVMDWVKSSLAAAASMTPERVVAGTKSSVFGGCLLKLSADTSVAAGGGGGVVVPYNSVVYDTDGFYDPAYPGYINIPAGSGIKKIQLYAGLVYSVGFPAAISLRINDGSGTSAIPGAGAARVWGNLDPTGGTTTELPVVALSGAPIDVTLIAEELRFYVCRVAQLSGSAKTVLSGPSHTYFGLRVIERE